MWPRPVQDPLPVWVAVGGTPQSVVRAGTLGLPLALAIIGGQPERFVALVELYRKAWSAAGQDPADARLAINTRAFVGRTFEEADAAFANSYLQMMNRIGCERGWPPSGRPEYEALKSARGALAVGGPEQVAEKILFEHELFGNDRYIGQMSVGAVAHRDVMRSIEPLRDRGRADRAGRGPAAPAAGARSCRLEPLGRRTDGGRSGPHQPARARRPERLG